MSTPQGLHRVIPSYKRGRYGSEDEMWREPSLDEVDSWIAENTDASRQKIFAAFSRPLNRINFLQKSFLTQNPSEEFHDLTLMWSQFRNRQHSRGATRVIAVIKNGASYCFAGADLLDLIAVNRGEFPRQTNILFPKLADHLAEALQEAVDYADYDEHIDFQPSEDQILAWMELVKDEPLSVMRQVILKAFKEVKGPTHDGTNFSLRDNSLTGESMRTYFSSFADANGIFDPQNTHFIVTVGKEGCERVFIGDEISDLIRANTGKTPQPEKLGMPSLTHYQIDDLIDLVGFLELDPLGV